MKFLLLPTVLLCVTASSVFADSVACSIDDQSVACSGMDTGGFGIYNLNGPQVGFTVSRNVVEAFHFVYVGGSSDVPYGHGSVDVTFDDMITFTTRPGDLLRITANTLTIRASLTTSIGIVGNSVPNLQFGADDRCPSMSNCGYWATILASGGLQYLRLEGEDLINIWSGDGPQVFPYDSQSFADVKIEQFKSDGVTPDPFAAPEPSSIALGAAGLAVLGLFDRYRRRAYRGSHEAC